MVEPTGEQCNNNEKVKETHDSVHYACWYPQMGGYVGKAVICVDKCPQIGCVEVFVWHDGEFPFSGKDENPTQLHHCNGYQFISFGEFMNKVNGESEND